ncbi:MAG: cell division protein FtsA [Flavobacteriales bacterium]|jgi:cell division protein FtsA|nr:cell division protein FtsA [Flavobacteriales bacterium]
MTQNTTSQNQSEQPIDQSDIIVGLDIGTTKIACLVGRRTENNKVHLLGYGISESLGVNRGVVSNIEKTVASIRTAIAEAEKNSGVEIKVVNVGIAGQHISSIQHRGLLTRNNLEDEISKSDIEALINDMTKLSMNPGEQIIHVLPQEYTVDNEQGIKDPVGMSGIRLEANFHIITGHVAAARNIYRCVTKAGLQVDNLVLEPLASSEAVLTEEEKEAGIALVDIGGGTTDIAIFQDGIIRHTAVIPFGGNAITDDIKQGCTIMRYQAEMLKKKFGSALSLEMKDNDVAVIPGLKGREPKEIKLTTLASIIQARMEEIIEHVYFEIKSSGFEKKLIGGIVITGGGSQMKHITQLFQYVTGMDCRIGYPNEHVSKSPNKELFLPMFSTGIGLVMKGFEGHSTHVSESKPVEKEVKPLDTPVEQPVVKQEKRGMTAFLNAVRDWFDTEEE